MKVVFKLKENQFKEALVRLEEVNKLKDHKGFVGCGNLAYQIDPGQAGIAKQELNLDIDGKTLTYDGRRTALHEGKSNCIGIIEKIIGKDYREIKPYKEETTAPWLKWWAINSVDEKTPQEELEGYVSLVGIYVLKDKAIVEFKKRIDSNPCAKAILAEMSKEKLAASFSSSELKESYRQINLLNKLKDY
jgi:hypothetical protein